MVELEENSKEGIRAEVGEEEEEGQFTVLGAVDDKAGCCSRSHSMYVLLCFGVRMKRRRESRNCRSVVPLSEAGCTGHKSASSLQGELLSFRVAKGVGKKDSSEGSPTRILI